MICPGIKATGAVHKQACALSLSVIARRSRSNLCQKKIAASGLGPSSQ